jgi:hypothetical protein
MQTRSKTNGIPTRPGPLIDSDSDEEDQCRLVQLVEKYLEKTKWRSGTNCLEKNPGY